MAVDCVVLSSTIIVIAISCETEYRFPAGKGRALARPDLDHAGQTQMMRLEKRHQETKAEPRAQAICSFWETLRATVIANASLACFRDTYISLSA